MKIRVYLILIGVSLGIGVPSGFILGRIPQGSLKETDATPKVNAQKKHHDISLEKGHLSCIQISVEEATEIVQIEIKNPTISILKNQKIKGVEFEFMEHSESFGSNYSIQAFLGKHEDQLWTFEVDHLTKLICEITVKKIYPRPMAKKWIIEAFTKSTSPKVHPFLEGKSIVKEDILFSRFVPRPKGGWFIFFSLKTYEGRWSVTINNDGTVDHIGRGQH